MLVRWFQIVSFLCAFGITLFAQPIGVDPANPHYYSYHGKPILLITSAEHYGAVINRDFDYLPYLDTLQSFGLNYTRIYPGALFEPMGKFLSGNVLGPKMGALIVPWARSSTPGYLFGSNRFDLDQWDSKYFSRLKDFIEQAGRRGIFVEICFFNSQYSDTWPLSPLNHENNIQGVCKGDWQDAQTLKDPELVRRYDDYVRKITREVNAADNVILEVCDEPASIGTGVALAGPWVSHLVDTVRQTESGLPKKHLIAQEVDGRFDSVMDLSSDPRVPVIVAQYTWGREPDERGGEIGGMKALDFKYGLNKPIEMNETFYYPLSYQGDKIADSRVEAWEFMVGGGAGFNQLNGIFVPRNPAGQSPDNLQLLSGLRNLRQFLESFEYVRMQPDSIFAGTSDKKAGVYCRVISEAGKQYAMYVHPSRDQTSGYTAIPGHYQENLVVYLPGGTYKVDWVDPALGKATASAEITHPGGQLKLKSPEYTVDIALRIKRAQ